MRPLEHLRQDVRHAFRALRKERSFALTAIVILALGIGAQAAVFSLVNGILLRPLGYRDPGRLYAIQEVVPQLSNTYPVLPVNGRHYFEWTRHCRSCESIALINTDDAGLNLAGTGEPERISDEKVTANYFSVLGIGTQIGRTFEPENGQAGRDNVVVLSDSLWRRKFGADPSVIGRSITLNDAPMTVIGVLPAWFRAPAWQSLGIPMRERVDIFRPWVIKESDWDAMGDFDFGAVVRLRPGASASQASAELNVIQAQIASTFKGEDRFDLLARLSPLQERITSQERSGLWLLLGSVAAVLLIVCVNLGNLMLSRALGRTRETAVRIALGASRGRIVRGILVECLVLAFAGGLLGVVLAETLVRLLVSAAPVDLPRLSEVHVDWRVLLFALGAAAISGLFFGVFPAWRLTRVDPQDAMRSGSRGSTESGGRMRVRELLVSVEVALSCLLLIVAGLLLTSFARLMGVDRGFEVQHILTAEIAPSRPRYDDDAKRQRLYHDVIAKLQTEPGVMSAGVISVLPLNGQFWADLISVPGDTRPIMERPIAAFRPVTPDYFRTMGIRLIAGRAIAESDQPRKVVIVSQHTAEAVWPGQDPIGKEFKRGDPKEPSYEIVGVVGDVRATSLQDAPGLMVYVPYWDRAPWSAAIAVRTVGDPVTAAGAIREAVWSVDSQLPVSDIETMEQIESRSLSRRRFQITLLAVFAGSALLLSALGTYGVLAFSVARRTNEIGIRMALGAQPTNILSMVMRRGLVPVTFGLVAGVAGALALGKVLSGLLFAVSPYDWRTILGVIVLTMICAVAACWIPARRATRVDPLEA
ncbi:MAG TPA: ABC transporter permease, partial [Candidatus Acidoferrales bacterium]|nr:ABC transporter permease [Candidatus Acidoferrales bacterium]